MEEVARMEKKPRLAAILVGDDLRSELYVNTKKEKCNKLGISFELHKLNIYDSKKLSNLINKLNNDSSITSILLQLPLPKNIDPIMFFSMIDPLKDVDGVNPLNIGNSILGFPALIPCTAKGVMQLLEENDITVKGQDIVVIGTSHIVGRPLIRELIKKEATLSVCNIKTKDISQYTKNADIIISATGHKHLITKDMVKKGSTIIDIGITKENNVIYGDVDFKNVKEVTKNITTHPGGVGPMTVISLMSNIVESYKMQENK